MNISVRAWHFTSYTLRDGRPIPAIGETLRHDGPVKICETGLHASVRLVDALSYAPGLRLHAVYVSDVVTEYSDKLVARERTILESRTVDMRRLVRFALECAGLAFFAAGLDDDRLIAACRLADAGDFPAAAAAAADAGDFPTSWAASWAAAGAAGAARAAVAAAQAAARWAAAADAARAARAAAWAAAAEAAQVSWAWTADARDMVEDRARVLLWGPS